MLDFRKTLQPQGEWKERSSMQAPRFSVFGFVADASGRYFINLISQRLSTTRYRPRYTWDRPGTDSETVVSISDKQASTEGEQSVQDSPMETRIDHPTCVEETLARASPWKPSNDDP